MKKTLIAIATTALVATAATASAECGFGHKTASGGMQKTVMTGGHDASGFVRTGGYGKSYAGGQAAAPDIVDTAVSAGSFTTLVKAVQAAGLVETLKGDGTFTVFAPTDEAFARLPAGTLEALLADQDKLAQILKYHVVAGKLDASKVTSMDRLETVAGSELAVADIKIARTDIMTANGVIHVIDEVLIPQS